MDNPGIPTDEVTRAVNEVMRAARVLNGALETAAKRGIRFDVAVEMHPISLSRATSGYATISVTVQELHSWSAPPHS